MTKEILSRLDVLAAKLGQTASALWPHAVRHTAIEGFAAVAIWLMFAVVALGLIVFGGVWGKKEKWGEGLWIAPVVVGFVLCIFCAMGAGVGGSDAIAQALEPTGYTVKAILRGMK